jgi:hypothetical protein
MKQLNEQEAYSFAKNGVWKKLNDLERAWFQLYQTRLAMPISEYHRCMEILLDRPVYNYELYDQEPLKAEVITKQKPTFQQVFSKIPRDKIIMVIETDPTDGDAEKELKN